MAVSTQDVRAGTKPGTEVDDGGRSHVRSRRLFANALLFAVVSGPFLGCTRQDSAEQTPTAVRPPVSRGPVYAAPYYQIAPEEKVRLPDPRLT